MKAKATSIITAIIMVISMVTILPVMTVSAETYGDYTYTVLEDGTIEITKHVGSDSELIIPSEIDGKAVTVIGDSAFKNHDYLRNVVLPATIKHIGDSAFYGCTIITKFDIPYGVETIGSNAFYDTSLSSISLPGSITSISNAFDQCWSLSSITYGDGFTKITSDLFPGYPANAAITKITIGKDVDEIEFPSYLPQFKTITVDSQNATFCTVNGVLYNKEMTEVLRMPPASNIKDYTIPATVTTIGTRAFYDCNNLMSLTIPDSVTTIGDNGISSCYNLRSLTLPDSIEYIGKYAFSGSEFTQGVVLPSKIVTLSEGTFSGAKIPTIEIPSNVTSIGKRAFYGSNLGQIKIPASVTSIGEEAFDHCFYLNDITVDSGNQYYSSYSGVLFNKDKTLLIKNPAHKTRTTYTIPDTVKEIGPNAFYNCRNLKEIIIPSGVETIDDSAFYGCWVDSINIPDTVTSIGKEAFRNCANDNCTEITIPGSVETIGENAFSTNRSIEKVNISEGVTTIEKQAFYNNQSLTNVFIPKSVTAIGEYAFGYTHDTPNPVKVKGFRIRCYPGTAAEQYAIDNGFDYYLLTAELKYQLRPNDDGTTDTRFILIADEQEVLNTDSASVYATITGEGDTDAIIINRAYRSLKAGGKKITADEGKVFLIGKFIGIPDDMVNGMVGHFTLGENTYDRTITN